MKNIKYLIKFTNKIQYAKDLLEGKLYMNAAEHFHYLEMGQGDVREGAISSFYMFYKNTDHPIYCMYAVLEEKNDLEQKNGLEEKNDLEEIRVPIKVIKDFEAMYAVVIDFDKFNCDMAKGLVRTEFAIRHGLVKYKILSLDETKELLINDGLSTLFCKHPFFSYQNEYRIEIYDQAEPIIEKMEFGGMIVDSLKGYKPKIYQLTKNIGEYSKLINLEDCKVDKKYLYIKIND